jgi:hypothetical protein
MTSPSWSAKLHRGVRRFHNMSAQKLAKLCNLYPEQIFEDEPGGVTQGSRLQIRMSETGASLKFLNLLRKVH